MKYNVAPALILGIAILSCSSAMAAQNQHHQGMKSKRMSGMQHEMSGMGHTMPSDEKLDKLVRTMKTSQGADRVDATAAVVAEMVEEHRQMMRMCRMMCEHMGGMEPAPKHPKKGKHSTPPHKGHGSHTMR